MKLVALVCLIIAIKCSTAEGGCQQDADCLHGGTCIIDSGTDETHSNEAKENLCSCKSGYAGPRCAVYCPLQCQNGGTCEYEADAHSQGSLFSDYKCNCRSRFKGVFCEIPYLQCPDGTQCLNGASCITSDNGKTVAYTCSCKDMFEGIHCENEILREAAKSDLSTNSTSSKVKPGGIVVIVFTAVGVLGGIGVALFWKNRSNRNKAASSVVIVGNLDADGSSTMQTANSDSHIVAETSQEIHVESDSGELI